MSEGGGRMEGGSMQADCVKSDSKTQSLSYTPLNTFRVGDH